MYIQITFVGIMLLLIVTILDFLNLTKNAARLVIEICVVMTFGLLCDHFSPEIMSFVKEHPYWFWLFIVPAILMASTILYEELTEHTGVITTFGIFAVVPGVNLMICGVVTYVILHQMTTDPKSIWRGMTGRFNFSKKP